LKKYNIYVYVRKEVNKLMVESRYYDYGTSPRKTDPIPQRRTTTKRSNPNVKKELTKKPSNSSKSKASKKKEL